MTPDQVLELAATNACHVIESKEAHEGVIVCSSDNSSLTFGGWLTVWFVPTENTFALMQGAPAVKGLTPDTMVLAGAIKACSERLRWSRVTFAYAPSQSLQLALQLSGVSYESRAVCDNTTVAPLKFEVPARTSTGDAAGADGSKQADKEPENVLWIAVPPRLLERAHMEKANEELLSVWRTLLRGDVPVRTVVWQLPPLNKFSKDYQKFIVLVCNGMRRFTRTLKAENSHTVCMRNALSGAESSALLVCTLKPARE